MVILERSSSKLILEISLPSIKICPSAAYRILSKHNMIVDLPDPVLPTTPSLCPPVIVKLRPLSTRSKFFLYLHFKLIKSILPLSGQPSEWILLCKALTLFVSRSLRYSTYPYSGYKSIKVSHLSIDCSSVSKLPRLFMK